MIMVRQRICALDELGEGKSIKFNFSQEGVPREGFAVRFQNQIVAYENVCRHVPISLDYGDGQFFSPDGKYFVCQSHGAVYEPLTGLCVGGPCPGSRLKRLEVEVQGGVLWLNSE